VKAGLAVSLKYLTLVLACAVVLLPLGVMLLVSLKTQADVLNKPALSAPSSWFNLANYRIAFRDGHMLLAFGNTALILLVSVTGTVLIGSMAAYALDRFAFRLRGLVILLFLLATLVPGVTTQVATFQVVNSLHLFDTRWAPIMLYLGTDIVAIYIFLQFIRSIPTSLDESARLDGANSFTIYWRIILPLLKPAIVTVVIIKGIYIYNEFYIPFLYMPSRDLGVVSTSLFRFKGPFSAQWEVISAGVVIAVIPTLAVFLALQRWIYNGFAAGSTR
jgi:multiple sugar transport system permease protein